MGITRGPFGVSLTGDFGQLEVVDRLGALRPSGPKPQALASSPRRAACLKKMARISSSVVWQPGTAKTLTSRPTRREGGGVSMMTWMMALLWGLRLRWRLARISGMEEDNSQPCRRTVCRASPGYFLGRISLPCPKHDTLYTMHDARCRCSDSTHLVMCRSVGRHRSRSGDIT